jgi:hypothetical protein
VVQFQKPLTRQAAAWVGVSEALKFFSTVHCSKDDCLGFLILMPVAGMVGGIAGAVKGVSRESLMAPEDALNGYIASLNFQEVMREQFVSAAAEETHFRFILLDVQSPSAPDEATAYDAGQLQHVDVVLEVGVRECHLRGTPGAIDSPLRLSMTAGIRLIRVRDRTELCRRDVIYDQGANRLKFSEWGANNAQAFREELDRAFRYLSVEIVRALSDIQTPFDPLL